MKIPKGHNILTYLQQQSKSVIAPCNGKGICGKCKVKIIEPTEPNEIEKSMLSEQEIMLGIRLACTRKTDKEITVQLDTDHNMSIVDKYRMNFTPNPYITSKKNDSKYHIYRSEQLISKQDRNVAYGVAIDIGTTTVVVSLINIISNQLIETKSFLNPQSSHGSDVISRIQSAATQEGLTNLQSLITNEIDKTIHQLLDKNGISSELLFEVVIAGNTTMNHLLLGIDPSSMAVAPYTANILHKVEHSYCDIFPSDLKANVTIFGGFDAYVGGDILSGVYSENLHNKEKYHLLVDLGTNGEIALINKHQKLATSTAAGPAFEGVNITHGTGAVSGAINTFELNRSMTTINDKKPIGICGSGLIDIVAELLRHGTVDKTGRMKQPFHLTDDIALYPKDIREMQLAKSAIRAGIEYLIEQADISFDDIEQVHLAGGFGYHINKDNLFLLGIIPPELNNRLHVIGNASLSGTVKYLLSPLSDELESIRTSCKVVNLGTSLRFQDLFVKYIHFN